MAGDEAHNGLVDGVSLAGILRRPDERLDRETLYWHYPHYHAGGATPYSAIRDGDWRLCISTRMIASNFTTLLKTSAKNATWRIQCPTRHASCGQIGRLARRGGCPRALAESKCGMKPERRLNVDGRVPDLAGSPLGLTAPTWTISWAISLWSISRTFCTPWAP